MSKTKKNQQKTAAGSQKSVAGGQDAPAGPANPQSAITSPKNPQSGRPAGSVTATCEPVTAVKPLCVKCHSSNLLRKAVLREMEHFTNHDGVKTTRRRWTRAMCRACGQWQTIREDFNP